MGYSSFHVHDSSLRCLPLPRSFYLSSSRPVHTLTSVSPPYLITLICLSFAPQVAAFATSFGWRHLHILVLRQPSLSPISGMTVIGLALTLLPDLPTLRTTHNADCIHRLLLIFKFAYERSHALQLASPFENQDRDNTDISRLSRFIPGSTFACAFQSRLYIRTLFSFLEGFPSPYAPQRLHP